MKPCLFYRQNDAFERVRQNPSIVFRGHFRGIPDTVYFYIHVKHIVEIHTSNEMRKVCLCMNS